jgi:predicted RNase H-like HicB family nuclease
MPGYIALVHKDEGTSYGVSFPDVPGCISAGDTLDEALANAAEALAGHLALIDADGDSPPRARNLAAIKADPELEDDLGDALIRVVEPATHDLPLGSAAISQYAYDEVRRELYIRYRGGAAYTYHEVPLEDFVGLTETDSKGKFVNRVIKQRYVFTEGAPI